MVICGGELDAVDERITRQEDDDEDDEDDEAGGESGLLKCLQIDLRKFGLGEVLCKYNGR